MITLDKYDQNWMDMTEEELLEALRKSRGSNIRVVKGGPGSGHFGHAGRPGKVGGSAPSNGKKRVVSKYPKANPEGKDTLEQYRYADGTWTPERQALHDKIIAHFYEGKTPVDNPTSYVLGGGPAAGKSTLLREGYLDAPENTVLASGDDIKKMLPEYEGSNAHLLHEESSYLSKKIAYGAANDSYNVMMDGTGDGEIFSLKKKVKSMRPLGQPVIGMYVTVDADTAVKRAIARAKKTGRYIPESVVRYSHMMIARIYPDIIKMDLYDNVNLYDTSTPTPKLIAKEVGKNFTIVDEEAYQRFLDRGK
jgi:predicted ABC-type ATPase